MLYRAEWLTSYTPYQPEISQGTLQSIFEAEEDPDIILQAPHTTPVRRVDEVAAARNLVLRWRPEGRKT